MSVDEQAALDLLTRPHHDFKENEGDLMLQLENSRVARSVALLLSISMTLPTALAGCGGGTTTAPPDAPPPGMANTRPADNPAMQPRQGMTTKQKLAILAGAAALYYIYNKRKAAREKAGPNGQYFRSESTGRIYYRNLKTGEFQWVSPPRQAIQVPYEEAQQYSQYSGFNNRRDGQSFGGYGPGAGNYQDAEPAFLPPNLR